MWISTFHALCARLLRREAPHIGLSRDFVIYDSTDQLTLMKQALREARHRRRRRFSRGWRSRESATPRTGWRARRSSASAWNPPRRSRSASSTRSYTKALKDANALDFDDLLLKTVELFEKSASGARALQRRSSAT